MGDVRAAFTEAVAAYWRTRDKQGKRQKASDRRDKGARGAVTGGRQMDGFISLVASLFEDAGISPEHIFARKAVTLPGYFRPTKEWDLLVVRDEQLLLALEVKSHAGPSFGNNFNNRTEEAMGSALDLWTAFREGAFGKARAPWLGYLFLLEDCESSRSSVRISEPHFDVFPEFKEASYAKRYELFCRRLVRERHYSATALLLSRDKKKAKKAIDGEFHEPAEDLGTEQFVSSLLAHAAAAAK